MEGLISIIIPVYNVEGTLSRCLTSIVNQTYENIEIILVDDGSTDSCGIICDKWAKKDGRIRVIHKTNGGVSSARNSGLEIARGDLLGFVDPDDKIELEMYEKLLSSLGAADAWLFDAHASSPWKVPALFLLLLCVYGWVYRPLASE